MEMPGRNGNSGDYRYGFNGMEKDNEVKGNGNHLDFGARGYDPRLGRWLSTDPKYYLQPGWSPYKAFLDNPLIYVDPEGETEYLTIIINNAQTGETKIKVITLNNNVFASGPRTIEDPILGDYKETVYSDKNTTITINIDKDGMGTVSEPVTEFTDEAFAVKNPGGSSEMLVNILWDVLSFDYKGTPSPSMTEGDGDGDVGGGWNRVGDADGPSPPKTKSVNAETLDDAIVGLVSGLSGGQNLGKELDAVKGAFTQISSTVFEWNDMVTNSKKDYDKATDFLLTPYKVVSKGKPKATFTPSPIRDGAGRPTYKCSTCKVLTSDTTSYHKSSESHQNNP